MALNVASASSLDARLSRFGGLLTTLRSECDEISALLKGAEPDDRPAAWSRGTSGTSGADWPLGAEAWQLEPDNGALAVKRPALNQDGTAVEDTIQVRLVWKGVDEHTLAKDGVEENARKRPARRLVSFSADEDEDDNFKKKFLRNAAESIDDKDAAMDGLTVDDGFLAPNGRSTLVSHIAPDEDDVDFPVDVDGAEGWFGHLVAKGSEKSLPAARVAAISRRAQATLPAKLFSEAEAQLAINGVSTAVRRLKNRCSNSSAVDVGKLRSYAMLKETMDVQQFAALVEWESLALCFEDDEQRSAAWLLRDVLLKHSADEICAENAQLRLPDLEEEVLNPVSNSTDMLVLLIVLANTFTMALAADFPTKGLLLAESVFTGIYALEIFLRLILQGTCEFFRGRSAAWNIFDLLVTLASAGEECLSLFTMDSQGGSDVHYADMLRLVRLTRILRIVRVFRLGVLNEFRKMVYRIYSGCLPLFYASSVLFFIFFIMSVMLRQTIGVEEIPLNDIYGTIMFNSVPWTFFIVFRMFMGDDSLPDGTPLAMHLQVRYGYLFMIPYIFCYMLIVFGVFNTITATFVEAVIESSQQSTAPTACERLRTVQLLRQILLNMVGQRIQSPNIDRPRSFIQKLPRRIIPLARRLTTWLGLQPEWDVQDEIATIPFDGIVTFEKFMEGARTDKIGSFLQQLGIKMMDPESIFAALDHDYSRTLDIDEFVRGLMQLRSNYIDRTDIVSTLLGVRSMHIGLAEVKDLLQVIADNSLSDRQSNASVS
eukprot:TRINITY_DN4707_c0_g1_i1.p1 TRINITY_DN4707_c0_g1~~TRINITY_DN4707_c0_g1_i1.p1  ORF type:complete len:769 (+),score=131.02 TRINITY_DN4707_c0_g1_i1:76-2382(+)